MEQNHQQHRANSIPHSSKYYKGGKALKKIYKEVSSMNQNHLHQNHQQHRADSIPHSSKYLKGGNSMERSIEALNGMYDQIESEELAYYRNLFENEEEEEEEGDEK